MNYVRRPSRTRRKINPSILWSGLPLLAFTIVLAVLVLATTFLQNTTRGELIIAGYGLAVLLLRLPSVIPFRMGIICLLFVPAIVGLRQDSDLGESIAVYAFLLLVVGTILALTEQFIPDSWRLIHKRSPTNLQKSLEK